MLATSLTATATATAVHLTCDAVAALLRTATLLTSTACSAGAHPAAVRVKQRLEEMDVVCRVSIAQAFLLEVRGSRWLRERPSVKLAADCLRRAAAQLQSHLEALKAEHDAHAQRYFAAWRTPCFDADFDALAVWTTRLDERLGMLREVIALAAATQPRKDE